MTGMRLGELLAIKWTNLDWHRRQYFVRESLYNLSSMLLEALRGHRAQQAEGKFLMGEAFLDHDLIFCTTLGTPRDRGNLDPIPVGQIVCT
jgi:integrase